MPIRMSKVGHDVVELKGGLDQISPTLKLKAGVCRTAVNFECATEGGYTRVAGYERFDGNAKPSDASYAYVQVTAFTNTPTAGQTLTGGSSGATGQIIYVASTYMVLTLITGSFTTVEAVAVGATPIGTATTFTASVSSLEQAQYLNLAADVYRALINKVPGSGAVRGVFHFVVSGVDKTYAFRDNAGATGCDLYVASASGWTQINYKYEIAFTAGSTAVAVEGDILTQGGVTATVRRVMASSGSLTWAGTTAGRLVIDAPAGGNFAAGAATFTGSGATCTITAIQTAITMAAGGHFEFVISNFAGSASTLKVYGCDGANRGFEFDGTTLAPIATGASSDTPKHVVAHKNHLMWAIAASLIHSGPGTPFRYAATDSGGEIATGDTITNFLIQPGNQTVAALAVYGTSRTSILYGTGLSSWVFVPYDIAAGGFHYSGQNLSESYVLDHQGVISLKTTRAYGNFVQATLTNSLQTFITEERSKVICSVVSRDKSQYRLFFTDGYALYVTIVNGKLMGSMPVLFPVAANCAWAGELANGNEVSYFGGTDGYVYQMEKGSSFDGAAIDANITLNWNAMGSPRVKKRYRHASVAMRGDHYANIQFGYQLGYGTSEISQSTQVDYASGFSPAPSWDTFTWDSFTWDGRTLFPTEVDLRGSAENIEVTISSTTDYIYPFTVDSIIKHYSMRRGLR